MNAAAGMKTASISASPRRVNQLPVSFSFVTPCVSPFSLNHSSKRFDSCRLRRRTSYSSHLPIDFSQFYQSHSSYRSLRTEKKIVRFVVSVVSVFEISRDETKRNGSIGAELVKCASSRGIDFSAKRLPRKNQME